MGEGWRGERGGQTGSWWGPAGCHREWPALCRGELITGNVLVQIIYLHLEGVIRANEQGRTSYLSEALGKEMSTYCVNTFWSSTRLFITVKYT